MVLDWTVKLDRSGQKIFFVLFSFVENLAMDVSANFFMCNEALQWIKIGERDGWITLTPPICARQQNTPWASITLPGNIDCMYPKATFMRRHTTL